MGCVKDLPVDVLSKIASYKIGDPNIWKSNIVILRHWREYKTNIRFQDLVLK